MRKTIMNIRANEITNFSTITEIVSKIYNVTGKKASVNFNGSKGYLDHVEIIMEDQISVNNRIERVMLYSTKFNKSGLISIDITKEGIEVICYYEGLVVTWQTFFEDYIKT